MLENNKISFRCNICGNDNRLERQCFTGNLGYCRICRSSVRMRAAMYGLSFRLFGEAKALVDFPRHSGLAGIGLTDWKGYARRLRRLFRYKNTFLDRRPKLDITRATDRRDRYDFAIALEVLEHVPPPVEAAVSNFVRLLKPGGIAVLSAPYSPNAPTVEHFPALHEYKILNLFGAPRLINRRADGAFEFFDRLVFHGGPGKALEMRVFGRDHLIALLTNAGLPDLTFIDDVPEWGILYENECSHVITARKTAPTRVRDHGSEEECVAGHNAIENRAGRRAGPSSKSRRPGQRRDSEPGNTGID